MKPNVIIVGAGPGGLASALLLARAGLRVKIIERLPHVGGRTSAMRRKAIGSISGRRSSYTSGDSRTCW